MEGKQRGRGGATAPRTIDSLLDPFGLFASKKHATRVSQSSSSPPLKDINEPKRRSKREDKERKRPRDHSKKKVKKDKSSRKGEVKKKDDSAVNRKNSTAVDFSKLDHQEMLELFLYRIESGYRRRELRSMLKQDALLVNSFDKDGKTPLHFACSSGKMTAVKLILHKGADLNAPDKMGWTALTYAATNFQEDIILFLLKQEGIKVVANADGNTPLHYASRKNLSDAALQAFLAMGCDVNAQNKSGETPLHNSCWSDIAVVELLLRAGADPNSKTKHNETPLHWCASMGRLEHVALLVEHGADVNIKGRNGFPLDVAAPIEPLKSLLALKMEEKDLDLSRLQLGNSVEPKKTNVQLKLPDTIEPTPYLSAVNHSSAERSKIPQELIMNAESITFIKKLGAGSFAKVYLAEYGKEEIAVKVMQEMEGTDLDQFLNEFNVMHSIKSPYVAQLIGIVLEPAVCIAMKYFKRGSLFHVLQENLEMTWELFFRYTRDIIHCIDALHSLDPPIIHRDLKTLNLLVDNEDNVKICDFGLCRPHSQTFKSTLGKLKGTYAYSAPELYFGGISTPASDIYSFAIILWEIVSRLIYGSYHKPFAEFKNLTMGVQIIIQAAKNNQRPTIPPSCPEHLAHLIRACWDPSVARRPLSKQLLQMIEVLELEYCDDKASWQEALKPNDKEKPTVVESDLDSSTSEYDTSSEDDYNSETSSST